MCEFACPMYGYSHYSPIKIYLCLPLSLLQEKCPHPRQGRQTLTSPLGSIQQLIRGRGN